MKLTTDQLQRATGIRDEAARLWVVPINHAGELAQLKGPARWAMFLAQCGHESASFTRLVESLNYSPEGLMQTWPKRYSADLASLHGRTGTKAADQRAIANHVYNGRMGNKADSDDGWTFRGRGLIHVTGRDNYRECGRHIGVDLLATPDIIGNDRRHAAESAVWYWDTRNLNDYADRGDLRGCTKAINGGFNGLPDRERRYSMARAALGADVASELQRILSQ